MDRPERVRMALDDGKGGSIFICELDVVSVIQRDTKYGHRLLLTMQGPENQAPVWIDDSEKNRHLLKMEDVKGRGEQPPPHTSNPRDEAKPKPSRRDVFSPEIDDEIPF